MRSKSIRERISEMIKYEFEILNMLSPIKTIIADSMYISRKTHMKVLY